MTRMQVVVLRMYRRRISEMIADVERTVDLYAGNVDLARDLQATRAYLMAAQVGLKTRLRDAPEVDPAERQIENTTNGPQGGGQDTADVLHGSSWQEGDGAA